VRARRWLGLLALIAAAVLALAACGSTGSAPREHRPSGHAASPTPAPRISTSPESGAHGANPTDAVTLTVTNGTITSLQLKSSTGASVTGKLGEHRHAWTASEVLGYGHTYTWTGTVRGADGQAHPIGGSFETVKPSSTLSADFNVGKHTAYGVAMPIVVNFDRPVSREDRPAVQKALSVKTSKPTTGAWAWLSDRSVHWRPKKFWKPHTNVTVKARLYGLSLGGGEYGKADVTRHFHIGKKQKITGNTATHRLKLVADGKVVENYPTSYGLDSVLWRNTRSGTHVVMAKHPVYYMSSRRGGYQHVRTEWAVRISNNGEFIHAYPETLWAQGDQNVSHGCANLSTARAHHVYEWVQIGDPVIIKGSRAKLSAADGAYYDWTLSWKQWESHSALS
jgi:lipoprotein-anchoring transpeptidase ErfK/SrfK